MDVGTVQGNTRMYLERPVVSTVEQVRVACRYRGM
jgi:hypothetical protein